MIGLWTKKWAKKSNINCLYFESISSTNSYAKENIQDLDFPCLLVADEQLEGRGRGKNQWQGLKKGDGFYSTWLFKSEENFSPILTIKTGLLLVESLKTIKPKSDFSLKAPNDIFIDDNKIAGILLESLVSKDNYLLIGIGINVFSKPDLEKSGFLGNDIKESEWNLFLTNFWQHLKFLDIHKKTLNLEEQKKLITYLQKHFAEPIKRISEKGDIILQNHTIHWQDL